MCVAMPKHRTPRRDPTHVVGYCRVSTGRQAEEGLSLEAQEQAVVAYCAMRRLQLARMVVEPGASAGCPLAKRPGGVELLGLLDEGRVGGVVAMKLDRLFRDVLDCLATIQGWEERGVALHILDLAGISLDTTTAAGKMFLTMTAAFAEMERNLAAERTTAALRRKIEKGERVGRVPFGRRVGPDGRLLVPDPQAQAVLDRMREMRAGGSTLQGIVDRLNADGEPPPRARRGGRQGRRWHLATVHRLLAGVERG